MTRALSYVRDAERCVTGNAPMLCEVKRFYDETTVLSWLEMQIIALSELCGAKGKISELQAKFCAEQILSEYGFLKVTEVLLYFSNLVSGKYGYFYGTIDPQRILAWLHEFMHDREGIYEEYDARKAAEERDAEEKDRRENCVTYDEYLKMKANGLIKQEEQKK